MKIAARDVAASCQLAGGFANRLWPQTAASWPPCCTFAEEFSMSLERRPETMKGW
jgi:hypothetical protein